MRRLLAAAALCLLPATAVRPDVKRLRDPYLPGWRGVLTDGVTMGRFKVCAWLVGEDRDTAFDGSTEVDNPLRERTRILLPLATFDVRLTDRVGMQVAATIPDVTRTAVIAVRPARCTTGKTSGASGTRRPSAGIGSTRDGAGIRF